MNSKTTYRIHFHDNANRGSFAIDAIAATAQGDWTSSTDNFAILTVDSENESYTEEVLDADEKVDGYKKQRDGVTIELDLGTLSENLWNVLERESDENGSHKVGFTAETEEEAWKKIADAFLKLAKTAISE